MFRTVLNEMVEELKQLHQGTKEINKTITGLQEKIDGFDRRLENLQVVAPPVDLGPLQEQMTESISAFNQQAKETMEGMQGAFTRQLQTLTDTLAAEPKPIVRRISLFPENDRHGSYKYFIKALFLSILGFGLLAGLYALGQQWLDQRAAERSQVQVRPVYLPERAYPSAPQAPSSTGKVRKAVKRRREVDSSGLGVDTGR